MLREKKTSRSLFKNFVCASLVNLPKRTRTQILWNMHPTYANTACSTNPRPYRGGAQRGYLLPPYIIFKECARIFIGYSVWIMAASAPCTTNDQPKNVLVIFLHQGVDLLTQKLVRKISSFMPFTTGFSPCAEFSGYDVVVAVLLTWTP